MRHQYGFFNTPSGQSQYYQCWSPMQPVKAVLLIVHGLSEHSGRYMNLVNRFVPQGYAVFGFDHLGHGESSGFRNYIKDFSQFVAGVDMMVDRVNLDYPTQPLVLFGHSMGGLISCYYLSKYQHKVSAAVLSAPAIQVPQLVTPFHLKLLKIVARVLPKLYIDQFDVQGICRSQSVVDAYLEDPLVNTKGVTAKLGIEIIEAMAFVKARAPKIALPILVLQGTLDVLVNPRGANQLVEDVSSENKKLIEYKGLFHELINEPEREIVLNDIELWLDNQFAFEHKLEQANIASICGRD